MGLTGHFRWDFWALWRSVPNFFPYQIEPTNIKEYFEKLKFQNFIVLGVTGTQNGPLLAKIFFWKFFWQKMHMNQKVHSITSCLIPISWLQHHICQSYDRSKVTGTPKNTKFWTPIFPKIWVREQKNLVWLHVSPRGTCTPKMSKIGDKKFFDDRFLLWFQPECPVT